MQKGQYFPRARCVVHIDYLPCDGCFCTSSEVNKISESSRPREPSLAVRRPRQVWEILCKTKC